MVRRGGQPWCGGRYGPISAGDDLVGKGLFTGYVDWKAGRLISQDATLLANKIRDTGKCPNCGAPLSLAGKGLVKCEYCGAEYFLAGAATGPAPSAPPAG